MQELEHWKYKYEKQQEAMARMNSVYQTEKRKTHSANKDNKEKQSQIKLLQKQVRCCFVVPSICN